MENEGRRRKENALLKNISNVDERHERYPRPFEGKGHISTRNSRFRCLRCERDYNKHHFEICRDTGKYNIEYLFVYVCYFISFHKENFVGFRYSRAIDTRRAILGHQIGPLSGQQRDLVDDPRPVLPLGPVEDRRRPRETFPRQHRGDRDNGHTRIRRW